MTTIGLGVGLGRAKAIGGAGGLPSSVAGDQFLRFDPHEQGTDGNLVESMLSDEGYEFTASGNTRPTYRDGGPLGKGYIECSSGDRLLSTAAALLSAVTGNDKSATIGAIIRGRLAGGESAVCGWSSSSTDYMSPAIRDSDRNVICRRDDDASGPGTISSGALAYPNNTWFAFVFTYDEAAGTGKAYVDGTEVATGSLGTGGVTPDQFLIAARRDGTLSSGIDVSEVFGIDVLADASQLADIHDYLSAKLS